MVFGFVAMLTARFRSLPMAEAGVVRDRIGSWLILGASTAAVTLAFHLFSVPAALLLGPMLAGIAVAARGVDMAVPRWMAVAGQAVVGCLIASGMAGALGPRYASTGYSS